MQNMRHNSYIQSALSTGQSLNMLNILTLNGEMQDLKSTDKRCRISMNNMLDLEFRMCAIHKVNTLMRNKIISSNANSIGFTA